MRDACEGQGCPEGKFYKNWTCPPVQVTNCEPNQSHQILCPSINFQLTQPKFAAQNNKWKTLVKKTARLLAQGQHCVKNAKIIKFEDEKLSRSRGRLLLKEQPILSSFQLQSQSHHLRSVPIRCNCPNSNTLAKDHCDSIAFHIVNQ